jgi:hypothetical protein
VDLYALVTWLLGPVVDVGALVPGTWVALVMTLQHSNLTLVVFVVFLSVSSLSSSFSTY